MKTRLLFNIPPISSSGERSKSLSLSWSDINTSSVSFPNTGQMFIEHFWLSAPLTILPTLFSDGLQLLLGFYMFFLIFKKSFLLSVFLLMGHSVFQSIYGLIEGLIWWIKLLNKWAYTFQNLMKLSNPYKKNATRTESRRNLLLDFLC